MNQDASRAAAPKVTRIVIIGLLLWLVYFTATYIVMKFLIRGGLMHFASSPAAQGLAAVTEA